MAICIRNDTTPAIEIEYLSGCSRKSELPSFMLAPEVQTGYPLYQDNDNISNGWHVIVPKEAHNHVTNPTFFNDLGDWNSFNSLLTRTNINSFDSGFSGLIRGSGDTLTADRQEYIETIAEGVEPGQTYVFSAYVWFPQLFDSQDQVMGTISIVDDNGATTEEVFSEPVNRYGKWVRIAVSKTIRIDATSVTLRVNLRSQDARELTPPYNLTGDFNLQSEYMFVDMLQFENGNTPTTPFHGDMTCCTGSCESDNCCESYSWLSEPHGSISYRSGCAKDGGDLVSLSSLGFEILEHTGHGAPPVRDIYYDFTNRPGGKYQKTVVDTNVLTLSGYICEKSLKELECEIFGLQDLIFPDLSSCNRQMLLVYTHESCGKVDCDPERYLAYCVSYIGGLEGLRNNLFQQRLALQFRAHSPFPFEWPGSTSHALSFNTITSGPAVVKIGPDEIKGFALDDESYNTIACSYESDRFIVGGESAYIHDCEEVCEFEFVGGEINTSTTDEAGNIIIGGSFLAPYLRLAIYHPDTDDWAGFNYSGGDVLDVIAPFWAEVAVGATDGVHVIIDGVQTTWATNGPVNAIAMTTDGTLYAFGDFTTIDGVAASNAAKLDVNSTGCLDIDNAEWESLGFSLDGAVTAAAADGDTIYIGGEFTESTPDAVDTCTVVNSFKMDSKSGNQIVRFQNDTPAAGDLTIRFEVANIVARGMAGFCLTGADPERMLRITATSTLGTIYNFLIPEDALVASDFGSLAGALYVASVSIDKSYTLTAGSCQVDNEELVTDVADTIRLAEIFSGLNYAAGIGVDDTLNSVSFQCVQRTDSYQGDSTILNHVAAINGDTISALGDGLASAPNTLLVNPDTGELLAGTDDGLFVWTGREWTEYQGTFGNACSSEPIIDLAYCSGRLYVLYDGSGQSFLPGLTHVDYLGGVDTFDFELMIHGPGKIKSFSHCDKTMRFCTELQCGETAYLDFSDGSFESGNRNLGSSVIGGSRYDMSLSKCDNPLKLLITDTSASTKATLIYKRQYVGIEALCCSKPSRYAGTPDVLGFDPIDACCNDVTVDARDPEIDDCASEGYKVGDLWYNAAGICEPGAVSCPKLFVNADNECCDADAGAYQLIDRDGNIILETDGGDAVCPTP